jgi:hypothetical protein
VSRAEIPFQRSESREVVEEFEKVKNKRKVNVGEMERRDLSLEKEMIFTYSEAIEIVNFQRESGSQAVIVQTFRTLRTYKARRGGAAHLSSNFHLPASIEERAPGREKREEKGYGNKVGARVRKGARQE